MLVGLLLVMSVPMMMTDGARDVIRPNMGVNFHRIGGFQGSDNAWLHTFAVPWLEVDYEPMQTLSCTVVNAKAKPFCLTWGDMINDLNKHRGDTVDTINLHIRTVRGMLPGQGNGRKKRDTVNYNVTVTINESNHELGNGTRVKRAPFDFMSTISQSLFGTAKDSDVQEAAKHIDTVEQMEKVTEDRVTKVGEELSSFAKTSNARMDNAMAGIKQNTKLYKDLAIETRQLMVEQSTSLINFLQIQSNFTRMNVMATVTFDSLEREARGWVTGAQTLLNGYLPMEMVAPHQVTMAIEEVEKMLMSKYSQFRVSHKDIGYYYMNRDIMFTQTEKFIYITIKIPVDSSSSYFDLFAVSALPVPLNATTYNATLIRGLPPFFGVTRDAEFYVEMTAEAYATCHGTDVKKCKTGSTMRNKRYPSCASSLFFDDSDAAMKLCDIRYEVASLYEGAIDLGNNMYLASGSGDKWEKICADSAPTPIKAITFGLLELGCNCGLSSSKFMIPPKLSGCKRDNAGMDPTYLHPINLPVLKTLFPKGSKEVSGSTLSISPHLLELPDFKLADSKAAKVAEKDDKFKMSFSKITDNIKTSDTIYKSQVDLIRSQAAVDGGTTPGWLGQNSWSLGLASFPALLSLISLALSIYVCLSTRRTLSFMPVGGIPSVGAIQITNKSQNLKYDDFRPMINEIEEQLELTRNGTSIVNITEFDYKELIVDVVFGVLVALLILHLIMNLFACILIKL